MDSQTAIGGLRKRSFLTISEVDEAYGIIREKVVENAPEKDRESILSELEQERRRCCITIVKRLRDVAMAEKQYSAATECNFSAVEKALEEVGMSHGEVGIWRQQFGARLKRLRTDELVRLWAIANNPSREDFDRVHAITLIEKGFESAVFTQKMMPRGVSPRAREDLIRAAARGELKLSLAKVKERGEMKRQGRKEKKGLSENAAA